MPTAFATTKENNDSITLSVDTQGLRASSSIFLNNHLIRTIDDSFNDFFLGTNQGLKNNVVSVTTQVFKFPQEVTTSVVNYSVTGSADVSPDNPSVSTKPFQENAPIAPHNMAYFFI